MLPSGNDASLVIAYYLGSYCKKDKKQTASMSDYKINKSSFIKQMNKMAKKLGMKNTNFQNTHGLG